MTDVQTIIVSSPVVPVTLGGVGPQGVPGPGTFTIAAWTMPGTVLPWSINRINADGCAMLMPAGAANGVEVAFDVEQARAGFTVNGNGAKADGQAGDVPVPVTPCSIRYRKDAGSNNWMVVSLITGQTPP